MGIRSELFSWSHPNRYEVPSVNDSTDVVYYKGLIRYTRLTIDAFEKKEYDNYLPLMCDVVAPLLFAYTQWVVEDALRNKINTLYFVSRDGQIFYRIAQVICKQRKLSLELKYLYGSRQAWFSPAIYTIDDNEFQWASDNNSFLSVESLFARYNIPPDLYREVLIHNGFNPERWNDNLNSEERLTVKHILTVDPIKTGILESSRKQRKCLLLYLEQSGFFEDEKKALVDIGWYGRMQSALQKIIKNEKSDENSLRGYYFYNHKNTGKNKEEFKSFLEGKANAHAILRYDYLLEIFTYADHGGVLGFESGNDGSVYPVLDVYGITSIGMLPIKDYHCCIEKSVEKIINHVDSYSGLSVHTIKDNAAKNFVEFCEHPFDDEVRLIVSTKYSDEQKIHKKHDVILSASFLNILKWILRRSSMPFSFLWMEGIIIYNINNMVLRSLLFQLLRLRNVVKSN